MDCHDSEGSGIKRNAGRLLEKAGCFAAQPTEQSENEATIQNLGQWKSVVFEREIVWTSCELVWTPLNELV